MCADEEDVWVIIEYVMCAIAMMNIVVENGNLQKCPCQPVGQTGKDQMRHAAADEHMDVSSQVVMMTAVNLILMSACW